MDSPIGSVDRNVLSRVPVAGALVLGMTATSLALAAVQPAGAALTALVGSVLAWGSNALGYLGNGSTTESDVPVATTLPTGTSVTAAASHHFSSLAITATGSTGFAAEAHRPDDVESSRRCPGVLWGLLGFLSIQLPHVS